MPQAVESNAAELEQISERVRNLEQRMAALEAHSASPRSGQSQASESTYTLRQAQSLSSRSLLPFEMPGGIVSVVGTAVLGIAGAYLLRAISEIGSTFKLPILIVAIFYGAVWMIWAVRTYDKNHFASATYGVTSALILMPLLWETTVRFQVIPSTLTAMVLVTFTVLSLTLSWWRRLQFIPWVATIAVVITAMALIIATRDVVPLTVTVLALAFITETAACLEHPFSVRAVPALASDFVIWLLVYVMTSAEGAPEGYHQASTFTVSILCFALIATYGASIGIRSFVRRQRLSIFEIAQAVLAFALATLGILRATHNAASQVLGGLFLLLAAMFYWGALWHFATEPFSRNRRVSATWAAALLLAGTFLVFSVEWQAPFLCVAALASALLYSNTRKFSLGLHASFYLAAAAAVSPLPAYVGNAVAGSIPSAPEWKVWIVGVAAALCYFVGARSREERTERRSLWIVPAVLAGCAAAAILVVTISRISAGWMELTPPRLSVIRTIVNCSLSIALAFAGSRWKRVELAWVAYTAVVFGTLKLLLEDLRFGNAASLVVSLLCYGSVLILLPRLRNQAPQTS